MQGCWNRQTVRPSRLSDCPRIGENESCTDSEYKRVGSNPTPCTNWIKKMQYQMNRNVYRGGGRLWFTQRARIIQFNI